MSSVVIQIMSDDDIRITGTLSNVFRERHVGTIHGWNWNRFLHCWHFGNPGGEEKVARLLYDCILDDTAHNITIKRESCQKKRKIDHVTDDIESKFINFRKRCLVKGRTLSFFESSFTNLEQYNQAINKLTS